MRAGAAIGAEMTEQALPPRARSAAGSLRPGRETEWVATTCRPWCAPTRWQALVRCERPAGRDAELSAASPATPPGPVPTPSSGRADGCATAAGAGVMLGAIGGLSTSMGAFGLSALVVVIVGGLDSPFGALVGGLFIGMVEPYAGTYLVVECKLVATFTILILMLVVRPYGLFGTREIERL